MIEILDQDQEGSNYKTCMNDNLKDVIMFQNMRSLRGNYNNLRDLINQLTNLPSLIAMTEIWSPHPWQQNLQGFSKLISIERPGKSSNKGGGVGCYIRSDLTYTLIEQKITEDIEYQWIHLEHTGTKVINIYRPPRGNFENFLQVVRKT